MVKILLLLPTLWSLFLYADTGVPDPNDWFLSLSDDVFLQSPGLIRNISVDSTNSDQKLAWKKIAIEFSKIGFLQFVDASSLDLGRLFIAPNVKPPPKNQLLALSPIHLLLKDQQTRMVVLKRGSAGFEQSGDWSISPKDRQSSQLFFAWLSRNLGYDAVVLSQNRQYLLVGLLKNMSRLGQGVLLNDSAMAWQVDAARHQSDTLLQMVRVSGNLAVFEVLFKGDAAMGQIATGTKIVLGNGENVQKVIPERKKFD